MSLKSHKESLKKKIEKLLEKRESIEKEIAKFDAQITDIEAFEKKHSGEAA